MALSLETIVSVATSFLYVIAGPFFFYVALGMATAYLMSLDFLKGWHFRTYYGAIGFKARDHRVSCYRFFTSLHVYFQRCLDMATTYFMSLEILKVPLLDLLWS